MSNDSISKKSIRDLLEDISSLAKDAPEEDVKGILTYCVKQLKIAAISHRQDLMGSSDTESSPDSSL